MLEVHDTGFFDYCVLTEAQDLAIIRIEEQQNKNNLRITTFQLVNILHHIDSQLSDVPQTQT